MTKEPIRHHYIPQFILRNFACDHDNKLVYYCDKENRFISERAIREIFMEHNLYRDEINNADKPVKIEYDLAKYESEVAHIIKEKFLDGRKTEITSTEDKMLKLFFAIMSFRSTNAKEQLTRGLSQESREYYKYFQPNEDFEDFWKRNLGCLVQCRSIDDVINHPDIDPPIKLFMQRDANGLSAKYFVVVEAKDGEGFILGDCYPIVVSGDYMNLPMYDIFPISPSRAILLASVGVDATPRDALTLRPGVFDIPQKNDIGNAVITRKRLLSEEVHYINREVEKNSHKGFIFFRSPKN